MNAPQTTAVTKQKPTTIHGFLETYKSEITRALPKHMTADRMARIALTEFRKTPALMKCDPATLFGAVIQCAQLGLELLEHALGRVNAGDARRAEAVDERLRGPPGAASHVEHVVVVAGGDRHDQTLGPLDVEPDCSVVVGGCLAEPAGNKITVASHGGIVDDPPAQSPNLYRPIPSEGAPCLPPQACD